jgi:hypothetical protein
LPHFRGGAVISSRETTHLNLSPATDASSDGDLLHFIERDLIAHAIIKLRRARAFMCSHQLGVLQSATGFEICGDAGGAEGVAADAHLHSNVGGATLDHPIGVDPVHTIYGERTGLGCAPDRTA